MATINNPTEINNNTPNAGTEIEARIETLYQNDLSLNSELGTVKSRTEIQTGTGHAPAGTAVKMSWFEGTTNTIGRCDVTHGLGSNILDFICSIQIPSGEWIGDTNVQDINQRVKYYDSTILRIQFAEVDFYTQPVRFLVFHK